MNPSVCSFSFGQRVMSRREPLDWNLEPFMNVIPSLEWLLQRVGGEQGPRITVMGTQPQGPERLYLNPISAALWLCDPQQVIQPLCALFLH